MVFIQGFFSWRSVTYMSLLFRISSLVPHPLPSAPQSLHYSSSSFSRSSLWNLICVYPECRSTSVSRPIWYYIQLCLPGSRVGCLLGRVQEERTWWKRGAGQREPFLAALRRNVGVWRKDTTTQIFQTCHHDAEEQKEDGRKLGQRRSYASLALPGPGHTWPPSAAAWTSCYGMSGSGKRPGEMPAFAEPLEAGPAYPGSDRPTVWVWTQTGSSPPKGTSHLFSP